MPKTPLVNDELMPFRLESEVAAAFRAACARGPIKKHAEVLRLLVQAAVDSVDDYGEIPMPPRLVQRIAEPRRVVEYVQGGEVFRVVAEDPGPPRDKHLEPAAGDGPPLNVAAEVLKAAKKPAKGQRRPRK